MQNSSLFTIVPEIPIPQTTLDKKDGFIHLSNSAQVIQTASRFFDTEDEILVLKISHYQNGIKENIKWETPPGLEERFPHFYGDLLVKHIVDIVRVKNLKKGGSEGFEWPEGWLEV
ncbi:DUF952 domain-containing protein [Rhizophagus clarus]|uniref:DUF952 domain-containing protein n=1 Tax=Rhizophagus clarus TaxID=94130 RepID=A0A8H3MFN3_9GLOM|nr:DUF952 domain-containing protein [Rhizophagus clarus]